jgi:ribonuclease HI
MHIIVQTDGASRGNPGPSSYGYLIIDKETGKIIHMEGKKIGIATNNIAEYSAVLNAFQFIKDNFREEKNIKVDLMADSLLVIKQLAGFFKIKNPKLKLIFEQIKKLEFEMAEVTFKHIPREQNSRADRLANQALDR